MSEPMHASPEPTSNSQSVLAISANRWAPLAITIVAFALLALLLLGLSQCSGRDGADPLSASSQGAGSTASSSEDGAGAELSPSGASGQTDYDISGHVEELLQFPEMMAGCEIVSLTCMLDAMGYDVNMHDIAENYVEYGPSYVYTYSGDPYINGAGYPPVITDAGNAYLRQQNSDFQFKDITGTSFSDLAHWLDKNVPVLIWTTMYLQEPLHAYSYEDDYEWYDNEHCVLVYGITDDLVYVMDPMVGLTTYDRATFESVYDECGNMAISLDI